MAKKNYTNENEHIKSALSYDPATGEIRWLKVAPWVRIKVGDVAGHVNRKGYRVINIAGKVRRAHRVAWFLHYGEFPIDQIDHINGIKDDNRLVNLRQASSAENGRNKTAPKSNTSGFKGVSFHRKTKKWVAYITVDCKQKYLGLYESPEDAHAIRRIAEARMHGKFSR